MAKLIGTRTSDNFGENLFVDKALEYLDDDAIIYWNRQVYGREFDVCILLPNKGVLVVELKGWREENVVRIDNSDTIVVKVEDGEIHEAPQKQVRGYRYALQRHIKESIGKYPPMFTMVCFPQISKSFFEKRRLDVVTEERFTFLKEDLENNTAFFNKLDRALREVNTWKIEERAKFDERMMLEVRNLFETDIDVEAELKNHGTDLLKYHEHDYSRFYYISDDTYLNEETLQDITEQYFSGCKLYCVFTTNTQMHQVVSAIDRGLDQRGLRRNKNNIELSFSAEYKHTPECSKNIESFTSFHCSFSLVQSLPSNVDSFYISNGLYTAQQEEILKNLSKISQFNADQYFVEHALPEKNIVIRAGAGTGKTYTMISRVAYICYTQNTFLKNMIDRIVMITFTNEAADQMAKKLKVYFRNCYLLTSKNEYLQAVSQIDHMQISTIHSYAKKLIALLGTSFGYGIDLSITSSEFFRKKKISDCLDEYIKRKVKEDGNGYIDKLGMPVYAIRDNILDFIAKLHNKSIDIRSIKPNDFGTLHEDQDRKELHELLSYIIPTVEKEYLDELMDDNRIHLSSIMSILNSFIENPRSVERIGALNRDKNVLQFMFVDEFQDTDDTQIGVLLILAKLLNYRMFVVGDIKQCIYRFRGAEEMAFDQLQISSHEQDWLQFSLQRNYRTDTDLLNLFDISFSEWGKNLWGDEEALLKYDAEQDRLTGTREYNGYLKAYPDKYFKQIFAQNEEMRIPKLVEEIKRLQKRIAYEEGQGQKFTQEEKSIAILVRENWQAELVKSECAKLGITVQTNTGGDLYMSQPALDMLILVNALVHFDEADYLYSLVTSNFFKLDVPKSNLFNKRKSIRDKAWQAKADEREQINFLIELIDRELVGIGTWAELITELRTKPLLQAIRKIYDTLQPWFNYNKDDPDRQHYYQLNVDLLFEQVINACNIDRLTINTLQGYLQNCISSGLSVDSREVSNSSTKDVPIQCITVHKSKGLEYGHVIMPFCSASIDYIKKTQLQVSTIKEAGQLHIGYCMSVGENNQTIQNDYYDEKSEKSEKSREETRILYVAMTRAIRSFSWIVLCDEQKLSWQSLIMKG